MNEASWACYNSTSQIFHLDNWGSVLDISHILKRQKVVLQLYTNFDKIQIHTSLCISKSRLPLPPPQLVSWLNGLRISNSTQPYGLISQCSDSYTPLPPLLIFLKNKVIDPFERIRWKEKFYKQELKATRHILLTKTSLVFQDPVRNIKLLHLCYQLP